MYTAQQKAVRNGRKDLRRKEDDHQNDMGAGSMGKEAGFFDKHKMTGYGEPDKPSIVRFISSLPVTSCILPLASSFLLLGFLASVSLTQSPLNTFLSQEISLIDWGLTDPSQIGYVSVGVLDKKEGKELIVYDIRRQRPVVKEPEGPRGRLPSFKGDLFLVSLHSCFVELKFIFPYQRL